MVPALYWFFPKIARMTSFFPQPSRGIDVGAKTEVYEAIGDCVKNQKGVVVVSSEEEEVLGICDRVIVMKNGRIAAILNAKTATTEEIKHYAV